MQNHKSTKSKKLIVGGLVLAILLVIGGAAIWVDVPLLKTLEQVMRVARESGPMVYFSAMAILPAMGVPVMAFLLPVGALFGPEMGMGWVVLYSLVALAVNFIFSYLLARFFLHSIISTTLGRFGYKLPKIAESDTANLAVIIRVTPGIPFCVQNYLLGIARVPFVKFVVISCLISWSYATAYILFGDALLHGKAKVGILAVSIFVAAAAITRLARKHYSQKKDSIKKDGLGRKET